MCSIASIEEMVAKIRGEERDTKRNPIIRLPHGSEENEIDPHSLDSHLHKRTEGEEEGRNNCVRPL